MVQCTNKVACSHCSQEHNSKDYPGDLPQKCILCKGNHKAWDKICFNMKVEIEYIAKAPAQIPYKYPIKEKKQRVNDSLSNNDPFAEDEMDTQELIKKSPRLLPGKKQAPLKAAKFSAAGGPSIPNLIQRQRPQSCSHSPTKENQINAIFLQKNLATS